MKNEDGMMASDDEIIEAVEEAFRQAAEAGDNWADYVDLRLEDIGVIVDAAASREADKNGYGPICVLDDGRQIWHAEDTGRITITD